MWTFCHEIEFELRNFSFRIISNYNMAEAGTCDIEAIVVLL